MISSKFKNYLHSNSGFFIFLGSVCLLYVVQAYTMPELQASKYQGVINNTLVPICVSGAVSGYLVAGVVGYMSTGEESGYVVSGFLVWLLVTGVGYYLFILSIGGIDKTISKERRIESKQNVITKSGKSLVEPLIDLHESSRGSYRGLCENLPDLESEIRPGFQQNFWQTMKCAATADEYALSFGDSSSETEWRWCMDSSGFSGEANLDKGGVRCKRKSE